MIEIASDKRVEEETVHWNRMPFSLSIFSYSWTHAINKRKRRWNHRSGVINSQSQSCRNLFLFLELLIKFYWSTVDYECLLVDQILLFLIVSIEQEISNPRTQNNTGHRMPRFLHSWVASVFWEYILSLVTQELTVSLEMRVQELGTEIKNTGLWMRNNLLEFYWLAIKKR